MYCTHILISKLLTNNKDIIPNSNGRAKEKERDKQPTTTTTKTHTTTEKYETELKNEERRTVYTFSSNFCFQIIRFGVVNFWIG